MATKLSDFYQGDTKRWRVGFPYDIAGAAIKFTMKRRIDTSAPAVQVSAELDEPDGSGEVFGGVLEITSTESNALVPTEYYCEHEITLANGDVGTFLAQKIKVLADLN